MKGRAALCAAAVLIGVAGWWVLRADDAAGPAPSWCLGILLPFDELVDGATTANGDAELRRFAKGLLDEAYDDDFASSAPAVDRGSAEIIERAARQAASGAIDTDRREQAIEAHEELRSRHEEACGEVTGNG